VSLRIMIGMVLAAVVAGPPLYGLVQTGQLAPDTALTRAALVAGARAVGVGLIGRLARGYHAEAEAAAVATADPAPAPASTPTPDGPQADPATAVGEPAAAARDA
jgi:hypothetical protein